MAHLWVAVPYNDDWAIVNLDGDAKAVVLDGDAANPIRVRCSSSDAGPVLILGAGRETEQKTWVLLAREKAEVRVNGTRVLGGLRVLRDRDEIAVGGSRLYFSTERLARVEPFAGPEERVVACPRCKQPMEPGTPSVCCPGCGLWHHQTEDLPCWTYSAVCSMCSQKTDLDAGFGWTPEEL
jgi:hypothetical protein